MFYAVVNLVKKKNNSYLQSDQVFGYFNFKGIIYILYLCVRTYDVICGTESSGTSFTSHITAEMIDDYNYFVASFQLKNP